MTAAQVQADVTAAQNAGNTILTAIATVDPAVALPAETADQVLELTAALVGAALTAYSNASGTPITAASVQALLPNATPLTDPTTTS